MLVEFQGSNNQVVSIATRHAFAVLQQLLRACCDRTCREREATYREQSDVIRIYFSVQVRFDEFLYLGVFNFCLEKMSNTLVSVTEFCHLNRRRRLVMLSILSSRNGRVRRKLLASCKVGWKHASELDEEGIPEVQCYRKCRVT
ncbi:uncharacterized protein LOC134188003 [Corticium candelabrum]|uniref:uncharacterized protein LOC134188003 n=1 Tax=Corticium candelabrum TaxID=121492 RepID=UPI002E276A7A|nr:uncharacterized protein LOC134188003 [Corticium candelabrum]